MPLAQINLVVADLECSHSFYTAVGLQMRAITLPGSDAPQAWTTTAGFAPVTVHSVEFAAWWDDSAPTPEPGSAIMDVAFENRAEAERLLGLVPSAGGRVTQGLKDMPWGEAYAILTDPDGYRWGVRA